MQLVYDLKD